MTGRQIIVILCILLKKDEVQAAALSVQGVLWKGMQNIS